MGLATAKRLIDRGFAVTVAGATEEKLAQAREQVSGELETVRLDLTDRGAVSAFAERVR